MNYYSLISFTSLFLFFNSSKAFSFQNVDQLLANPDITWAGEVYVDYIPNVNILDPENEKIKERHETIDYNAIDLLKVKKQVSDNQLSAVPNLLSHKFFQLNSKTLNVYKDSTLKEKLSYKAYQKIIHQEISKTKMYSDPETFEQIIEVVKSELDASHVEQFRLRQILAYNATTNQLSITPIAIAPLQSINEFITRKEKALFWMPIKEAFTIINLDNSSINWAKRFHKDIFSNSIKTIKGTSDLSNIFMEMIVKYRANASTAKLYQIEGDNKQLVALSPEVVQELGIEEEYVTTFDPKTYEEIIAVVDNSVRAEILQKIRVIQDWVWDDQTQTIQLRSVVFSPLIHQHDSKGNESNYRHHPYFYVKAGE